MVAAVGDTVVDLTPVLHVFDGRQTIDEKALTSAIEMGDERTFEQEPKYAIRLLVDIAIKALSPAINDPTTAAQAFNQIEDLLLRLGYRCLEVGEFRDSEGQLRLVVPYPACEDFLRLAFDEIRYCGAHSVQVMRRMMALVNDLVTRLPENRHPALLHWEERLQTTIARSFEDLEEKAGGLGRRPAGAGRASQAGGEGLEPRNLRLGAERDREILLATSRIPL